MLDPETAPLAELDRQLAELQKRYRTASHVVGERRERPDGIDDATYDWWVAAHNAVWRRRFELNAQPQAVRRRAARAAQGPAPQATSLTRTPTVTRAPTMGKYDPLFRHLCTMQRRRRRDDVRRDRTTRRPAARRRHHETGVVDQRPGTAPAHARAWLDAGRHVDSVDRSGRRVRFSAARWRRSS